MNNSWKMDKRFNKKVVIFILIIVLMSTLSCAISYEGINFGSDPEVGVLEDER